MPEMNLREISTATLREAAVTTDGTVQLRIIAPGWSANGRYYPAEVLRRDGPTVFTEGLQTYIDHGLLSEEHDRPGGRSIRDLAGYLATTARYEESGPAGPGLYAEARLRDAYRPLVDDLADVIGVSIVAEGTGETGERDGQRGTIITSLTSAESVDYVNRAAAGGRVLALIESVQSGRVAEAAHGMSANELRDALQAALADRLTDPPPYVWVRDFAESWVVYEQGNETYRLGYTVTDGTIDLGSAPVEVRPVTTFVPVSESVREAVTLREARNAGQWLESHIHLDFTRLADSLAADGHLSREERIALSGAIGDALDAFNTRVATDAPQLYQRDPFAEPDPAPTPVIESRREHPAMPISDEEARQLREAAETAQRERDEARADLARRNDADQLREAADAVRGAVDAVDIPGQFEAVTESIRERARSAVQVVRDTDGQIVGDALTEAARRAVGAEVEALTTLAESAGVGVRGAGSTGDPQPAPTKPEDYTSFGLSESAAKILATKS